jgi:hypothetical protein
MSDNSTFCSKIGKANVQRVFVEIEDVKGTLQKPTGTGFVLPARQATLTQTPTFTPSDELNASLNVTEQFQDAVEPADLSIPMILRLSKTERPQGDALFHALMGVEQAPSVATAALVGALTTSETSIVIDTVAGGEFPPVGVVTIGSEKILYMGMTEDTTIPGQWTLENCTRGYDGTTVASGEAEAAVTLSSRVWMQDVCRPSVSVWIQSDHTVFFAEGVTVTAATAPLSNTGGQHIDFTLQGKRMGWCGTAEITSVASDVITLGGRGAYAFSEGGYIQNATKNDANSGQGYKITNVDRKAGKITVTPTPSGWVAQDVIKPWLPDGVERGEPVESRDARIYIADAAGIPVAEERMSGNINIGTPTEFTSPIGSEYPGDNADTTRDINIDAGMYFRSEDAEKIGLGYKGYEEAVTIILGETAGKKLAFHFPRVKFNTPEPSTDGAFMTLSQTGTALGKAGLRNRESSLYIVQI